MMRNEQKILFVFFIVAFFSCENMYISKKWAINRFKEETGIGEDCIIDSVNRDAGQACIFASLTDKGKENLLHRFKFVTNKEFLEQYSHQKGLVNYSRKLFNLDSATDSHLSIRDDYLYYLKVYTNSSGQIATSYYVTILSKKENKIIFTEAFYDL